MDSSEFKNLVKKTLKNKDFDNWSDDGLGWLVKKWVDFNYSIGSSMGNDMLRTQARQFIDEIKNELKNK